MRVAMKEFTAALDADKILGFENPHDGVGAVVDIFADFMDAMFWQVGLLPLIFSVCY